MQNKIVVRGARLHNLKNVTVEIPKNRLVVLTGVSGSGKSTLALDTLYREAGRQYMEALGLVTDGMSKPPVESITGLSPSVSVDQHLTNRSPRSTVGTATEIYTYLRVLFARLGHRPCPQCGRDVPPASEVESDQWEDDEGESDGDATVPCPSCGAKLPALSMASFSFNKPAGACPTCTGLGVVADLQVDRLFDLSRSVQDGGVVVWHPFNTERHVVTLRRAGEHYGFEFDPATPIGELGEIQRDLLYYGVEGEQFKRHFPNTPPPPTVLKGRFDGVVTNLRRRYTEGLSDSGLSMRTESLFVKQACPDCGGTRLRTESRQVQVAGRTIVELSQMPLEDVDAWLESVSVGLVGDECPIAEPVVTDVRERVRRLMSLGLGYLSMDRATPSLSAGEAERLRLSSLLGSGLSDVLYILDEPTIGLHQRDTTRLMRLLRELRDMGNTVLAIEHHIEFIGNCDYVVDVGPEGGKAGGQLVAQGTPEEVAHVEASHTGQYLMRLFSSL